MTINVTAPNQIFTSQSDTTVSVNLSSRFDDPFTTGLVARFELYDTSLAGGVAEVVLFDQPGQGAPLTVENFLDYVEADAYENSFMHRSVPGFIVQGGGYVTTDISSVQEIATNDPVQNEFRSDRSNVRGTIAMAKLGGDPNSATSQWFFNLADNSSNLDNQNGGFTVFGALASEADLAVADAIAALPLLATSAFGELPVITDNPTNPLVESLANLVRFRDITVSEVDELEFAVISNSNPDLVTATVVNNELVLNYADGQTGTTTLVLEATNLLGETRQEELSLTVGDGTRVSGSNQADELLGSNASNRLNGRGGNDQIVGFKRGDRLVGGGGNDNLDGDGGNDILIGGAGKDTLLGDGGQDTLRGGNAKDSLAGDNGNDILDGGKGSDTLEGGKGRDRFVLKGGPGRDTIADFSNGQDRLLLRGFSFGDLSITQQNQDTLIRSGSDALVLLTGIDADTITQADIV
ncbi:MAG: peptidylprolyl isomerase [Leptolyngbyaceae bacterium]|nr:peptidylprolyl isomerase [Leptolyngbyaceae bacterium]